MMRLFFVQIIVGYDTLVTLYANFENADEHSPKSNLPYCIHLNNLTHGH